VRPASGRTASTASGYRALAVTRRLSPSGRWRERQNTLSRLAPSPPLIQFVPLRMSSDAFQHASFQFRLIFAFDSATSSPLDGGVRGVLP
jgi:hypothetical protein